VANIGAYPQLSAYHPLARTETRKKGHALVLNAAEPVVCIGSSGITSALNTALSKLEYSQVPITAVEMVRPLTSFGAEALTESATMGLPVIFFLPYFGVWRGSLVTASVFVRAMVKWGEEEE